jgi:hypothetical protein
VAGIQSPSDMSIAGANSDQKLAAIITPAAKPSMASRTFLLMVLKKKTTPAPAAVTAQVKQVANSAWMMGFKPLNHTTTMKTSSVKNMRGQRLLLFKKH